MNLGNTSKHYRYDTPERRKLLDQKYRHVQPIVARRHKCDTTYTPEAMITTAPSISIAKPRNTRRKERNTTTTQENEHTTRFATLSLLGAIVTLALLYGAMLSSQGVQYAQDRYTLGVQPHAQVTLAQGKTTLLAIITHDQLTLVELPENNNIKSLHIAFIQKGIHIANISLDVQAENKVTLTLVTGYDVWPMQRKVTQVYSLTLKNGYYILS